MKSPLLFRLAGASLVGAMLLALSPVLSAQSASTYVTSGQDKYRQGNLDGAIADFTAALDLNSSYLGAYNGRGMSKFGQGNFDGAIADYSQAIKLKPSFAEAYYNRGTAELLQGNFDAAIADCTKAIELKKDLQGAYFHRGLARECQTNVEGASEDFAKALQLTAANDDAAAYTLLHSALLGKRMGGANDVKLKAASAWSNPWTKALASFLNDQISEAELLKIADVDDPGTKARHTTEALYFAGVCKLIAGDKAVAKRYFQKSYDDSGPTALVHRLSRTELDRP